MTNNSQSSSSFSVIFPVFCTLLGVIITSLLSWLSQSQAATVASRTACEVRVDNQELQIRTKAGSFLSAYGDMATYLTVAEKLSQQDLQKSSAPFFKSGFEMIAYSNTDLSLATAKLVNKAQEIILGNISYEAQESTKESFDNLFGQWTASYKSEIAEFSKKRDLCKLL